MINNAFYFILKPLSVLQIIRKQLDKNVKVTFKIYGFTNCSKHTASYLKKQRQSDYEIWSVNGM